MNRYLTIVVVTLVSTTTTSAQAPSPATRRAREIVAVINTATPASIRAYVDSAFSGEMRRMPMDAHISFFMGQREQSGGLEWVDVQEAAASRTTALLRRKLTGAPVAVAVTVAGRERIHSSKTDKMGDGSSFTETGGMRKKSFRRRR